MDSKKEEVYFLFRKLTPENQLFLLDIARSIQKAETGRQGIQGLLDSAALGAINENKYV